MAGCSRRRVSARRLVGIGATAGVIALAAGACGGSNGGSESGATVTSDDSEPELAAAEQQAPSRPQQRDCPEQVRPRGLRCATIEVPLERADPSVGKTRITYGVRPRSDRGRPSLGAILAIEGGPGYGSIVSARAYVRLFGPLLRRRELIVVDMRGTGHSRALDCPDLQQGLGPDPLGVAQCARRLGTAFASYRTAAAADDLDAVRRALGYRRLDVYGDSYGTFLAQSYAYRYPQTVRALVLDGAYPLRGESGWYPSLTRTGIRSLAVACRRSPECEGDAGARLERLVKKLRRKGRNLGLLLDALASGGYGPPDTYLKIDRAVRSYLNGNPGPYERLTTYGRVEFGPERYYSHGLELAVSCNDYSMIWDKEAFEPERRRQLEAAIREYDEDAFEPFTPREVALATEAGYLECITWPRPTELYEPPAPANAKRPRMPTLVIAGELDNVTTAAEGKAAAADFANSRFRVVRNAGHVPTLYRSRYPAAAWVRAFLQRHG